MNALANRGSPNELANGRTNQIVLNMVFGFTRCKIVYSSQTHGMRKQLGCLDLNLHKSVTPDMSK